MHKQMCITARSVVLRTVQDSFAVFSNSDAALTSAAFFDIWSLRDA
jgi:hypothetical protein